MSAGHTHALPTRQNQKYLLIALGLTSTFLIAEVVAGFITGSLALLSDAAHMLTDASALAIALVAIQIGKRPADKRRTFGYLRFEILAAAFNAILLFLVAMYILYEAYQRFRSPIEIESTGMLIVASLGLVINLISMKLLSAGKDSSLNIKGAYLEVWSDMLGSVGVIIGALVIRFTGWTWVDSVIAVGIGFWVLPRTWVLLRESINVLLEGVPEGMDLEKLQQSLLEIPSVQSVHDLHVWSISSGKVSLTMHVVSEDSENLHPVLIATIQSVLAEQFEIHHTTIQIEKQPCEQAAVEHSFGPSS
ncbi:Cobalt-zinc-cadmium resistance protein CzcD (Cation efflux system protein czcD) [Herminiimonas arsenicoxydans]|uniref:Cobalt-zinc-cadmium resistance protein CzcD (Cation efflux system protein czcD) n=1 Tax=Herminiimonas arsenicoxydans TaxID=204773 RepID=A4G5H6_HERAR|nr:Cobalt-zinc-cadmium resistance protein CzcD (Cation efflux system protein czcD) [Herminiimonas arsenicoxydans]